MKAEEILKVIESYSNNITDDATVVDDFSFQELAAELHQKFNASQKDEWVSVKDELPNDSDGRVLCWCEEINDLGKSSFFWNCSYSKLHGFTDQGKTYHVAYFKRVNPPKQ